MARTDFLIVLFLVVSPFATVAGCLLWVFSQRFKSVGAVMAIYSAGVFTGIILTALADPGPTLH
ncbi:hypothetical protein CIW50_10790 [Tardiphaga sp. P9-11]|nr:hypothetical protein CIW50_10790 [Tardiphaga sp. P9-11]